MNSLPACTSRRGRRRFSWPTAGPTSSAPPEHSVFMYLALKRAGMPAELHIYAGAAHDFGVRPSNHACSTWTRSCTDWLRDQGFLKPPKRH